MRAMSLRNFDKLGKRDFENGAVTSEIRLAIKQRQDLFAALEWALMRLELANETRYDGEGFGKAMATFREAKAANA